VAYKFTETGDRVICKFTDISFMRLVLRIVISEVSGFRSCVDEVPFWDVTPRHWVVRSRRVETT